MQVKSTPCEHAWKVVVEGKGKGKGKAKGKPARGEGDIVWCRRCGTLRSRGRYQRPDTVPKLILV